MNTSTKILQFIFSTEYWEDYLQTRKTKKVLVEFFKSESLDLQKAFVNNFDYPDDMIQEPVRYESNNGDIYYTLNFKSKELYENSGTKESALTNSLAVLDKFLPLGVTNNLEPQTPIQIPDTFSLLCSLVIVTDVTKNKTILNIFSVITKIYFISLIILGLIKYLLT